MATHLIYIYIYICIYIHTHTHTHTHQYKFLIKAICQCQWPRGLMRRSAAIRLLRSWVRIPPSHGCLSVVSIVCYQVEVCATSWPLVQRSPTDCGASLCVITNRNLTNEEPNINQLWLNLKIWDIPLDVLLHAINSNHQHNCWMSSHRLQYILGRENIKTILSKLLFTFNVQTKNKWSILPKFTNLN